MLQSLIVDEQGNFVRHYRVLLKDPPVASVLLEVAFLTVVMGVVHAAVMVSRQCKRRNAEEGLIRKEDRGAQDGGWVWCG